MTPSAFYLTPRERLDYGVTATLADDAENYVEARCFDGPVTAALHECAGYCDEHGLSVLCLSTPATIYADVRGRRHRSMGQTPEIVLLKDIGRTDLLHPTLIARITHPRKSVSPNGAARRRRG